VPVKNDYFETARLLIGYKCDVNHKTNEEETALMFAVENSNLEMMTMLIENGADLLAVKEIFVHVVLRDFNLHFIQKISIQSQKVVSCLYGFLE
jgi:ankyrin repeat protein